MAEHKVHRCCVTGFKWDGTPTGRVEKLAEHNTYVTGDNAEVGVLLVHDLFGWKFPNMRLLADHVAKEANVTVYLPDFWNGEELPWDLIAAEKFEELGLYKFLERHGRDVREPEIFACARAIRADRGHSRVGMFGYCYGGWAGFRLGAEEHRAAPLVDCISVAQPSLLKGKDVDEIAVPVQVLAPEHDVAFPPELKLYTFQNVMKRGVPFDYQHFPGVHHGCFSRGNPDIPGERLAMAQGKDAVVAWLVAHLHKPAAAAVAAAAAA